VPDVRRTAESEPTVAVAVLDDVSPDGLTDMAVVEFPWVRLVHTKESLGHARAHKLLAESSQADLIFLLNSDIERQRDAVGPRLRTLRPRAEGANVAARLVRPGWHTQP
jgi:GT2 family glycosyltransferase